MIGEALLLGTARLLFYQGRYAPTKLPIHSDLLSTKPEIVVELDVAVIPSGPRCLVPGSSLSSDLRVREPSSSSTRVS